MRASWRGAFWRLPAAKPANDNDGALKRRIDELFTAWPFLGSRRMTAMLRADGAPVNRKPVQRLMRLMGIAALGPPRTSKPAAGHRVYPERRPYQALADRTPMAVRREAIAGDGPVSGFQLRTEIRRSRCAGPLQRGRARTKPSAFTNFWYYCTRVSCAFAYHPEEAAKCAGVKSSQRVNCQYSDRLK
jgi:hypothetical protein